MGPFDHKNPKDWKKDVEVRFDMTRKPVKQARFLTPVAWLLSVIDFVFTPLTIHKTGMKGLKPPYLILSNHTSFKDFKVPSVLKDQPMVHKESKEQ